MKAALPGLAAPGSVAPPSQSCSGSSLAWSFACSLSLPPPGTGTGGCLPSRLLSEEQPGLRSWPLPSQHLPALGAFWIQSPCSGWSEKVPRGLRQRATSGRDLLSLDSTSPSCQEGSRLAKEHKASVPSGLLGIFSAKSPISPERNPEAGRPGGGGGERCCSTAATPGAL